MADELDNPLFDSVFAELDKQPTPFKAAAPSLLDETIDEVGRQSKVPVNLAGMKARDANPDQYQQIKDLSEKVGLDAGFVARNMPELKRQQVAKDISDIADKSPALGMWFAQDDNPAAIKVDELRHLSGLQWLVASGVEAFKGGRQQVEFGTLSNKVLMQTATPEELARADEIFNGQQPRTYGADGWLEQSWVGAGVQIPNLANYAITSLEGFVAGFAGGAVAGGGAALVAGQLGPQAATPEEIVTVPAAAIATGAWTGRAGALSAAYLTSFEQTAGPAFYEFKNMTDENGQKMDEDTARVAAYVVGAMGGALEVIGTEKIASLVPGADKVTGMFTKDAVKAALMQPTVRQALKDFSVNVAEAGLTEVSTEVAQQAVQVFAGELAKVYSNKTDGTAFEGKDAGAIADELVQAAEETAKAMTILGPVLGSTRLGSDLNKARRASTDKAIIDAVAEHAQNDELVKRLPAKAQSAIEALTADGPVQSVYISPEGIRTMFQTVEEVDAFIDAVGIRDEWNEASAIGRDVQIPFSTYYTKIAATEAQQALGPFIKLSPDAMTPIDAELFNEAWNEAKDQLIAEMDAANAEGKETLSAVERIAEDVKNKVMNAGIVPDQAEQYSKLYAAVFRTMGARMGMAPDEIYNRYGFDVQRALPGGEYKPVSALDISLSAIRSGRIPSIRRRVEKAKGKSLLERIRERGGVEDIGGEITATGLKGRQYVRKARGPDMLKGGDNANTPDATVSQLWQEGYFPEFQERPDPNALYEAIREELGGSKRYSATTQQSGEIAELGGLVAFADMLDELGIDPGTMTDDEVRTALEAATNADAESGALFQFAGTSAKTAPNSDQALVMLSEGATPEEIFSATGWTVGADGRLRFEISDEDARLSPDAESIAIRLEGHDGVVTDGTTLREVLIHDRLFEAYPALRDVKFRLTKNLSSNGRRGLAGIDLAGKVVTFDEDFWRGTIDIDTKGTTPLNALLHEIQHAIQIIEGFDSGKGGLAGGAAYRQSAGEVEARNTQKRQSMSAAERAVSDPITTASLPLSEQIAVVSPYSPSEEEVAAAKGRIDAASGAKSAAQRSAETEATVADFVARNAVDFEDVWHGDEPEWFLANAARDYLNGDDAHWQDGVRSFLRERMPVRELFQSVGPTDSDAFKAWFGDSKVVDADGKPLVVYHGTRATFEAFSVSAKGSRKTGDADASKGFFFATSRETAQTYAAADTRGEKLKEALGLSGGKVLETYLSIQNPFEFDFGGREYRSWEFADIIEAAKEAGHDGVLIRNVIDTGFADIDAASATDVWVAFQPTQIKSVNNRGTFDATDPRILMQEKRGSIQISEGRSVINLFDQANLSTFLHESGHFFLEVFKDLAQQGGPDGPMATDWQTTADFLGITGDTIPTEAHEKFARSFEAYLFEGNAPSEEVAGIFARFRSWLVFVYKQVQRLNAPINDKIRGVMDRLIATDEEIKSVTTAPEFRSAFKDAAEAGMTEPQWQAYQAQVAKAREQATRTMDARLMSEVARETTSEWREAKRKIRDEVQAEYQNEPVYRAMHYLRTGEWSEYSDDGIALPAPTERLFLDRDAIVSIMGEGALQRMPRSVPPMYRAKGGVSPDYLAELFGFQSGHDLLTRMMSVPSLPRAVAAEVDIRMKERFGDLMGDAVARAREAQEAITNDATGEVLEAELGVLVRKGYLTTSIRREDAKRAAKAAIRQKPIREALRQKLYMTANAKAAQEAERAILAQDWKAAVAAKQRQIVNHYMALEAVEAKRDVERAVNYLGRFTGRKRPTTVDAEYLDQIETLLERFDFRKAVSLTQAQRRLSLAAFIEAQEAAGNIVQIPDTLRNDAFRKPYKSMTVEDLLGLQDTVKNIEHLGRLKNRLLANKEAREFASARDEVVAAIGASQDEKPPAKTRNPTVLDEGLSMLKSLDASLLKIEQVLAWMDSDDVNGPLSRMIWRPIAAAEARENDLQAKYSAKFLEILQKLDPKRLNEWISFNGVKYQRSNIISVALNMGNEGNYDKMKRGEVWTDADVQTLVGNLDAAEWQAVQEIWDTINELWPQIAALQKRLTGVEPLKVEAREVQTPHGVLQGGYYPLIYDPNRSADVEDRAAANADKLFENTYLRPDTWHGFTKERTTAYARPIAFDINGAGAHLIAVIHDLTHREAIMDANKLLTNADVRAEIENRYGKEIYRQFIPWLQSIAHDRTPNDGLSAVNRVFRGIRSRATMVGMGFRVSTIITQVVGYSSSAEMVPVKRLAGAIKDFVRDPLAMSEEVNRLSGEMRFRSANLDRDIRDQIRAQTGQKSLLEQARKFAFVGIGYADRIVTVPTWVAAYQDHLSRLPTDKEGAIAHADKVVRMTGGSGSAKDLAAMTRGKNEAAKLVTMFYSYFSAYYNRQRNWGRAAKRAISDGTYSDFPSLLAQQVFMTVIPAVAARLIVGDGPGEDEGYAEWAARQIAMYPLSAVPIVRDVAGTFDKAFGYSFTPAGRAVDEAAIQPFKVMGDLIDGEAEAREVVVQALQTTGYALKLPTGQLATSTNNVWKAIEEDDFQLRDLVLTRKQ